MSERAPTHVELPPNDPRAERFGYVCHRCLKCCHHKNIRVNPYEVARLARNRGLTTTEFRAAWSRDGKGLLLAQTENGACVFLGSDGCTVHADRPLVCRLYPLAYERTATGVESFHHVETHPQSRGEFTLRGTIGDFLTEQDADPFMQAGNDYYDWFCAAYELLAQANGGDAAHSSAADEEAAGVLLDMDAAISRYCALSGAIEPTDIEARRKLHLRILYQHLEQQQEEPHEEG